MISYYYREVNFEDKSLEQILQYHKQQRGREIEPPTFWIKDSTVELELVSFH